MVKFFLKDTDQEVKVGDVIDIAIPMKTPFGMGVTTINKVEVTQASLKQLLERGIVYSKEDSIEKAMAIYKPVLRRLARKNNCSLESIVEFLNVLYSVSPEAHSMVMLEAIADKINQGHKITGKGYFVGRKNGLVLETKCCEKLGVPGFDSLEKANAAADLYKPFINE